MARSVFYVTALYSAVAIALARGWAGIEATISAAIVSISHLVAEAFPIAAPALSTEPFASNAAYARDNRSRAMSFTARRLQRMDPFRGFVSGSGGVGLGVALSA